MSLNYKEIHQTLIDISLSERPNAVNEDKSLVKKLKGHNYLYNYYLEYILQQVDIVIKAIQTPDIEICTIIKLYKSL